MCLCITLKHVISLGRVYSSKQDPPRAAPTGKTKVACVIKLPIPSKRHKAYVCTYVRYTFDYILYTEGTSVGRGPNPSRGPPGPSVQRRGPPVVIVPFPYRPRPHRDIYIYIYPDNAGPERSKLPRRPKGPRRPPAAARDQFRFSLHCIAPAGDSRVAKPTGGTGAQARLRRWMGLSDGPGPYAQTNPTKNWRQRPGPGPSPDPCFAHNADAPNAAE